MHQRLSVYLSIVLREENQNTTAISPLEKKGLRITKIQQRYLPLEDCFQMVSIQMSSSRLIMEALGLTGQFLQPVYQSLISCSPTSLKKRIFRVADTYDVSDLKDVCQDILIEDIDSENVME
ncbi:SKP1/BTB/POZ domain-containing protein, partial [Tanacetum coccineum]